MVVLLILPFILFALPVHAAITVGGYADLSARCPDLLKQLLAPHVRSGGVDLATYADLSRTMGAKLQPGAEILIQKLFNHLRTQNQSKRLRQLFATLEAESGTKLIFCLAEGNCKFAPGFEALHLHVAPKFEVPLGDNKKLLSQQPVDAGLKLEIEDVILLRLPQTFREFSAWLENFIEETSYFADFKLLDDWVESNQSRSRREESVDPLFTEMATVDGEAIYLPEGFVRLFLEVSAIDTIAELAKVLGGGRPPGYLARQMQSTLSYVRGMNSTSAKFILEYDLRPENLQQEFQKWRQQIETSREARSD